MRQPGWVIGGYVAGVLALGIFWWLQRLDLLSDTPYPVLAGLVVLNSVVNVPLTVWHRRRPTGVRTQVRFAIVAITTSVVLYAAGWGAAFVMGYAVGASMVLAEAPRANWRLAWTWNALAILAGELAVRWDVAPTLVAEDLGHSLAFAGAICLALIMWILSTTLNARVQAEEQLAIQASTDPLTGLANRASFTNGLAAACARRSPVALVFVDVDDFKEVNDTFGHDVGDAVLVEVGERLRSVVRDEDMVARLGGDEFILLVAGDSAVEIAPALADRVQDAFALSWPDIAPLSVHASVGVVLDADGTRGPEELLREADQAMYAGKRARELEGVRTTAATSS